MSIERDAPSIQPIETLYRGNLHRSRLEARWAVFLTSAGIKYDYEHEGFYIAEEETAYLPDFWLPECQTYVEIKPRGQNNSRAWGLCIRLQQAAGHRTLLIEGNPWPGEYFVRLHSELDHRTYRGVFQVVGGELWLVGDDWHTPINSVVDRFHLPELTTGETGPFEAARRFRVS